MPLLLLRVSALLAYVACFSYGRQGHASVGDVCSNPLGQFSKSPERVGAGFGPKRYREANDAPHALAMLLLACRQVASFIPPGKLWVSAQTGGFIRCHAGLSTVSRSCGRPVAFAVSFGEFFRFVENWVSAHPYLAAFGITGLKATASDLIAQYRERVAALSDLSMRAAQANASQFRIPIKDIDYSGSVEVVEIPVICNEEVCKVDDSVVWQRTFAFLLYGGLYQGCAQHFIYNECFPAWFGVGVDFFTVAAKVLFDQFVLTPLLCLPACYLFKALAFKYSLREGIERYLADAKRDLLFKYWLFWFPVQSLTFSIVPVVWRIPFIALCSFFWLILLSTISSRADNEVQTAATPLTQ